MATATKVGGYGNVPKVQAPRIAPWGKTPAGFQPPKPSSLIVSGSGHVPGYTQGQANFTPAFTPNIPGVPTFTPAKPGEAPQLAGGGGGGGGAGGTDPRDPTYWTNIGKIKTHFDNTMQDYTTQETAGQTKLTQALNEFDKQQPIDTGNARGQFNKSGLFYSTRLGQEEKNIAGKFEGARDAAKAGFGALVGQLTTLRGRTTATYGEGGSAYADELNAATDRQTGRDTAAANSNQLATLAQLMSGGGYGDPTPGGGAGATPGSVVGGQFQSSILSPGTTSLINQWMQQSKAKPSSRPLNYWGRR